MEKLTLKEITPYLPYNVKVSDIHVLHAGNGIGSIEHILTTENKQYKLRLRPLSDLTKEDKSDNEYFCFLDRLKDSCSVRLRQELDDLIKYKNYGDMPFWFMQEMFKHHIDIFGLIQQNKAVDINTLNK